MEDSFTVAITHTINKLLEISSRFGFTESSMMNLYTSIIVSNTECELIELWAADASNF